MYFAVVNHFVSGGWLEFLTTVKLSDDSGFDRKAELDRLDADAAGKKVDERRKQIREALEAAATAQGLNLSDAELRKMTGRVMSVVGHHAGAPTELDAAISTQLELLFLVDAAAPSDRAAGAAATGAPRPPPTSQLLPAFSLLTATSAPIATGELRIGRRRLSGEYTITGALDDVELALTPGNSSFGELGPKLISLLSVPLNAMLNHALLPLINVVLGDGWGIPPFQYEFDFFDTPYHLSLYPDDPELELAEGFALIGTDLKAVVTPGRQVVARHSMGRSTASST